MKATTPVITFETNVAGLQAMELGAELGYGLRIDDIAPQTATEIVGDAVNMLSTSRQDLALQYPDMELPELLSDNEALETVYGLMATIRKRIGYNSSPGELPAPAPKFVAASMMVERLGLVRSQILPGGQDFAERWPRRYFTGDLALFRLAARLSIKHGEETQDLRVFGEVPSLNDRVVAGYTDSHKVADSTSSLEAAQLHVLEMRERMAKYVNTPGTRVEIRQLSGQGSRFSQASLADTFGSLMPGMGTRYGLPPSEPRYKYIVSDQE